MKKALITLSFAASPAVAFAATPQNLTEVTNLFTSVIRTLVLPLLASLTILAFLWGTGKFIGKAGDPKSHTEGRSMLIAGVVGLFLFVTIYGILSFIYNDFGATSNSNLTQPSGFFLSLPTS